MSSFLQLLCVFPGFPLWKEYEDIGAGFRLLYQLPYVPLWVNKKTNAAIHTPTSLKRLTLTTALSLVKPCRDIKDWKVILGVESLILATFLHFLVFTWSLIPNALSLLQHISVSLEAQVWLQPGTITKLTLGLSTPESCQKEDLIHTLTHSGKQKFRCRCSFLLGEILVPGFLPLPFCRFSPWQSETVATWVRYLQSHTSGFHLLTTEALKTCCFWARSWSVASCDKFQLL